MLGLGLKDKFLAFALALKPTALALQLEALALAPKALTLALS